jgi:hypothetical protein
MTGDYDEYWSETDPVIEDNTFWDKTIPAAGFDDFWTETKPVAGGRHARGARSRRPAKVARPVTAARPVRLAAKVTLLVGVIGLAAAICGTFDLIPRSDSAAINEALPGPAPSLSRQVTDPESTQADQRVMKPSPSRRPARPQLKPAKRAAHPVPTTDPVPSQPAPVELPLSTYFNNVAVTSNSKPTLGDLDGSGSAFSVQALAARGIRPGGLVTYDGVPFSWPDAPTARADNVIAAGQAIQVQEAGSTLSFLVTAGWGPAKGTAKVVYSNGSVQRFTLAAWDWYRNCPSPKGSGVAIYTPYRNQGNGRASFRVCVYYASVPLNASLLVERVILPDISPAEPRPNHPSLHIFAITIS